MIIKKVKDRKKRGIERTSAYIADAKSAAPGESFGKKVEFSGTVNTLSDNWKEATQEIAILSGSYTKESDATTAHWIVSLQEGDRFTQQSAEDTVKTVLKHLGMQDHPCIWTVHQDKKNHHIHMAFSRVNPEPDEKGEYNVVWRGATIESKNGNNEIASGHVAIAELCEKYGWKAEENARYGWKDGQYFRNHHPTKNADTIRLGQRVESWEARSGIKHPKRLMAEAALTAIRSANGDKPAAVAALAASGIIYTDVDYTDAKGRRHQGGKLSGPSGEEVKISALPQDCRWISKAPAVEQPPISHEKASHFYAQITTHGGAKKYIKQAINESRTGAEFFEKLSQKNLIFEKTGKAGGRVRYGTKDTEIIKLSECGASFLDLSKKFDDFSDYAEKMHQAQGKVNAEIRRDATGGNKDASNIHENSISQVARAIFAEAKTTGEMQEMFEKQGITFTRATATDRASGRTFEYGKLTRGAEAITLKSLGIKDDGKAQFTLAGIDRVMLARDAAQVLSQAGSWKEAELSLANIGISYSRVKTSSANGQEVIVGRLERDGVTSSTGLAGKDFQPAALDAKLLPYAEAKMLYESARLEKNPVAFLAQKGLTASDIDRIGRVGEKLEKSLKTQGKPKSKEAEHGPRGQDSPVIPRGIKQILEEIASAAQEAARLAQASARANRAEWQASKAEAKAEAAEKALSDLKNSIQREQPAGTPAAKEKIMSGTEHAPVENPEKRAGGVSEKDTAQAKNAEIAEREKEREKTRQQMQRDRERARQRM